MHGNGRRKRIARGAHLHSPRLLRLPIYILKEGKWKEGGDARQGEDARTCTRPVIYSSMLPFMLLMKICNAFHLHSPRLARRLHARGGVDLE